MENSRKMICTKSRNQFQRIAENEAMIQWKPPDTSFLSEFMYFHVWEIFDVLDDTSLTGAAFQTLLRADERGQQVVDEGSQK